MLTEGAKMPELDVIDDQGKKFNTRELLGKSLVLWFYPKDDTPG